MSLDKYVVGFVFGVAVGVAVASPVKEVAPAVIEQIQMDEKKSVPGRIWEVMPEDEKHLPEAMPFKEIRPMQQAYKPAERTYLLS